MMVRAKFVVTKAGPYANGYGEVWLSPVYSEDPNHENKAFWDATPSGSIQMTINNQKAFEQFEPNKEYYIDFTKAE